LYGILTIGILLLGVWLSARVEAIRGEKDSSVIVIDEIAGFLVTMFGLPFHWVTVFAGFLLFRLFDIAKPFPIRKIDQSLPGGWGVMLDDILAGVYANLGLRLLVKVFF
jgi:phosphatidylglycerophosphatase A